MQTIRGMIERHGHVVYRENRKLIGSKVAYWFEEMKGTAPVIYVSPAMFDLLTDRECGNDFELLLLNSIKVKRQTP